MYIPIAVSFGIDDTINCRLMIDTPGKWVYTIAQTITSWDGQTQGAMQVRITHKDALL